MRKNFEPSLKEVLRQEGGYVDHPSDPGGATMKGITIGTYREYKRNPYITKEQLKAIPDSEVTDIYRSRYWNPLRCDDMPDGVDFLLFDFGVNAGVGRSAKMLQQILKVAQDGIIGPKTVEAAKSMDKDKLIIEFSEAKEAFYKSLKTFPVFGKGWLKRVAESAETAKSLSA